VALQGEGREWVKLFSKETVAKFDYVFTDAMTFTDDNGKRMRIWIKEEVGEIKDAERFMDMLVDRAVGILDHEAIDIHANPTVLPDALAADYDRLWTEQRRSRAIEAASRNQVAIELNDLYRLPGKTFVLQAKAGGCKFTLGTNNTGPGDLGRSEYGVRMIRECGLSEEDFFVPGRGGLKAAERKRQAFRSRQTRS